MANPASFSSASTFTSRAERSFGTTPSQYFGHTNITRKILGAFIDFFSKRIFIERLDEQGYPHKYVKVPIHISNRERFMQIVKSSSKEGLNTSNDVYLQNVLPRMSVNISSMSYDGTRKINKFQKVRARNIDGTEGSLENIISPVPYNLSFEMSILTKLYDDAWQIIEQIVPYFQPAFSLNLKLLDNYEPVSVPFVLESVTPDAVDEYGLTDDRVFLSTLSFKANANYYYIKRNAKIIKQILANFNVGKLSADDYVRYKQYELNSVNLSPVTTVAERENEPITTTITEY